MPLKAFSRLQSWLFHRLPACQEVTRLVSESMDRRLTMRERIGVQLHLWVCAWCRRYDRQLQFLRRAFHVHGEQSEAPTLSPEAREAMKRRLSGE
jgi:hypothetical protein